MEPGSEGHRSGGDRSLREYFCLADGRTAALVHCSGRCDFWCWPGFDSPLRLARLLDSMEGGWVGVGAPGQPTSEAGWVGSSRVMRIHQAGGLELHIGLLDDGGGRSALAWLVEGPVGAEIEISLGSPSAGGGATWSEAPHGARLASGGSEDGPGGPLALAASAPIRRRLGAWSLEIPPGGLVVWLGALGVAERLPPGLARVGDHPAAAVEETRHALEELLADDERWLRGLHTSPRLSRFGDQAPAWALGAVDRSLLTLRGLQDRASGLLVASPTTSIPQWPASSRSWDYRYAWLRDCADAGIALAHAGAAPEAERVGAGLAQLLGNHPGQAAPVHRVSGAALPPEHTLAHLAGYSSAVVRVGNGAEDQLQLDTLGEVIRLASELERTSLCPRSLRSLVPAMARVAARDWPLPDHGIWEVRGDPQQYVHSKVMAWAALRCAAEIEGGGGDIEVVGEWRHAAAEIRAEVDRHGLGSGGELVMSFQDPATDSSLLAAYLVGFLDPGAPRAGATLDRVLRELGRGPIVMRHTPERDGIPAPCFPFIFPGLWAAMAEASLGRAPQAAARFLAIWRLAGPAGQLSEVADPEAGELWGNYPQVQSQAALVEAALTIWGARRSEGM